MYHSVTAGFLNNVLVTEALLDLRNLDVINFLQIIFEKCSIDDVELLPMLDINFECMYRIPWPLVYVQDDALAKVNLFSVNIGFSLTTFRSSNLKLTF